MQDWDPTCYFRFEAERVRPVKELVEKIHFPNATTITDLGCGLGDSVAILFKKFPKATITGVDSSPSMLEKARAILPGCQFEQGNICNWIPAKKQNVIVANASLQWLPNHEILFPRLVSLLSPRGILAIQMPNSGQEPTHRLMREVAHEQGVLLDNNNALLSVQTYYDLLSSAGCEVDIWQSTYYHALPSTQAMVDWLTATEFHHFIHTLSSTQQERYLARYHELLELHYKKSKNSKIIMSHPRLFILARKSL